MCGIEQLMLRTQKQQQVTIILKVLSLNLGVEKFLVSWYRNAIFLAYETNIAFYDMVSSISDNFLTVLNQDLRI